MRIAIFSDVHGRILLAFKLVLRYQIETGNKIDYILQCGDVGIYPDINKLDKATIRHAEKDPSELGFNKYFVKPNKITEDILNQLDCNMICIRGNHEDHEYLDELEKKASTSSYSVDYYKKIYMLKTGEIYSINNTTILGIGRAAPIFGETDIYKAKYIQEYELNRLYNLKTKFDILLTHDSAKDFVTEGYGMDAIRLILDEYKPKYHFYGHTCEPYLKKIDFNNITIVSKLSDLSWNNDSTLNDNSFGILNIDLNNNYNFETLNYKWLKEYNKFQWEYI